MAISDQAAGRVRAFAHGISMDTSTSLRSLEIEREAARSLLLAIRDDIADDAELAHDMVLGETGLFEAIDRALARRREVQAHQSAIKEQEQGLKARRDRFAAQEEKIEAAIAVAMGAIGQRKIERPTATCYFAKVQDALVVEAAPTDLPEDLVKIERKADGAMIRAALKDGREIAGCRLEPRPDTIRIRGV